MITTLTDHHAYFTAYTQPSRIKTGYLVRFDNNDIETYSNYTWLIRHCMDECEGRWFWLNGIKEIWDYSTRRKIDMESIEELENENYKNECEYERDVRSDYYASR